MAYTGITQPLNTTAFGELATATKSPRIQLQFAYNINRDEVSVSVTGSATVYQSQPFAVCSATATNTSAILFSKNNLHYRTGQGGLVFFTSIFTDGKENSTQLVGLGSETDGLFFGYSGTVFSILRRDNGTDNWIPQSAWNSDPLNGSGSSLMTLDPTRGNVYKIQYQWLGFGAINFFVENPALGSLSLVHQIKYSNSFTATTLFNPSLPLYIQAKNGTNNTNISVKVPSMAAFVEGELANTGLLNSTYREQVVDLTGTNIVTIQNKPTFSGVTNRKYVQPLMLSLADAAGTDAIFSLTLNPTFSSSNYLDISTDTSVVSYTVSNPATSQGPLITGGRVLATFFVDSGLSTTIDISDLNILLNANDLLSLSGRPVSGGNITVRAAIMWNEQF